MSWYRTGTVAVTNGSKTVTGVGTLWTTAVNAGDAFALVDANLNPTGAWYEVESVTNNTTLVLKQSYAGTTGSNKMYCVFNLVGNMTTPSFAQRLATFFASFQSLIDKPTTAPTASSIPIADANGDIDSGWIKDATETVKGVVELATAAEATAGADTTRAITPSVSGSRITFATTSTDNATSATAAPLKSAGGLAVAKDVFLGSSSLLQRTQMPVNTVVTQEYFTGTGGNAPGGYFQYCKIAGTRYVGTSSTVLKLLVKTDTSANTSGYLNIRGIATQSNTSIPLAFSAECNLSLGYNAPTSNTSTVLRSDGNISSIAFAGLGSTIRKVEVAITFNTAVLGVSFVVEVMSGQHPIQGICVDAADITLS